MWSISASTIKPPPGSSRPGPGSAAACSTSSAAASAAAAARPHVRRGCTTIIARAQRRRLFSDASGGGGDPDDIEEKYADWIDADDGPQNPGGRGASRGGSGAGSRAASPAPGSPRGGLDPTVSAEERSAALAMMQRSGLMSISVIREAYLQRVAQVRAGRPFHSVRRLPVNAARSRWWGPLSPIIQPLNHNQPPPARLPPPKQDLQEASSAAPGNVLGAEASQLLSQLSKLEEELGEEFESDWRSAEVVLTTTGRASKQGGAARLMQRPAHPGVGLGVLGSVLGLVLCVLLRTL
jgi:hypothetical protein